MRLALLFWILSVVAVQAEDACHDLWFTRNLVLDRAGQCFGTNLGRAVFDDANCSTRSPTLSKQDQALIFLLEQKEKKLDCKVNTDSSRPPVKVVWLRMQMKTLPIVSATRLTCNEWNGPFIKLYSGIDPETSKRTGEIEVDDNVIFAHEPRGKWQFVTVERSSEYVGAGWFESDLTKKILGDNQYCDAPG